MPSNPLASAARTVTQPMRSFLNSHFEAVKNEIRARNGEQTAQLDRSITAATHAAVLPQIEASRVEANARAEHATFTTAERFDEQRHRLDAMAATLADLQHTNDQLLAVVSELVKQPDGPLGTGTRHDEPKR